jgi:hypothetical protein
MAPAEDSATPKTTAVQPAESSPATVQPPLAPRKPAPQRAAARRRFLDGLIVAVVLIFAFLTALFPARNSDFFLHAATGRLIAHGQYQIGVDPFAFTTAVARWINTNWLYDLIVYWIYDASTFGGTILIVLKALLIAALAEVMLRTARQPGRALWVPACCVALAVLALSPRVLLQPVCISFFFLGATCWLLHLPRRMRALAEARQSAPPRRPFLAYWLIPPLCLFWVNLDSWFFLGPILIVLYLAGRGVQDVLSSSGRERSSWAPGELRTLVLVLAASLAACLVNPHHVYAFTPPSALGLSDAAGALARDDQFLSLFLSPFDKEYFHLQLGLNVAGLAFFFLALAGVVSFAAAQWIGRWSWERALVWTVFLALALWRVSAIPFFAVVAGPIASLNFLDFALKRFGPAPAVAGRAGTWALGGRVLTLLAGLALLAAAWPGWLQGASESRRVGWTVEPDAALVRMTQRIHDWQSQSGMKPGQRWVNVSPYILPYLAWYCPGERGCIDRERLPLYDETARAVFKPLRESLAVQNGDAGQPDPRWRKLLRSLDAHFVICFEPNPLGRPSSSLPTLLSAPEEWPLLYTDGPASIFGWRDPAKDEPLPVLGISTAGLTATPAGLGPLLAAPALLDARFARFEIPMERQAFGPLAAPVPAPTTTPTREWWTALWTPETPRPPEVDEAAVQWIRFLYLQPRWRASNEADWKESWQKTKQVYLADAAAVCVGSGGSWTGPFESAALIRRLDFLENEAPPFPTSPEQPFYYQAVRQYDYGPPAPLYLSIRAARRALALKPDDAEAYLVLAQDYYLLTHQTREGDRASQIGYPPAGVAYPMQLRRVQILAALHRALELDPNNRLGEMRSKEMYLETEFWDLALDHAQKELVLAEASKVAANELQSLRQGVDQLQKRFHQQDDVYRLKTANKRIAEKVETALQMGLAQTALDELLKVDWSAYDDKDPTKLLLEQRELDLLVLTGRVDEVVKELKDDEAKLSEGLAVDPDVSLPAYDWLRVEAAAAGGDYADADLWLEKIQKKLEQDLTLLGVLEPSGAIAPNGAGLANPDARSLAALMVGGLVLRQARRPRRRSGRRPHFAKPYGKRRSCGRASPSSPRRSAAWRTLRRCAAGWPWNPATSPRPAPISTRRWR